MRNDAAGLRRLLTWHRPLYDEAVVVDTGSTDGSGAVAKELGSKVTDFPWRDDFSAARNHGLGLAWGQWILVLDCDEVVAREDFAAIRSLTGSPRAAFDFRQRNYCGLVNDPGWIPVSGDGPLVPAGAAGFIDVDTCRLFPAHPDVYYEGRVHEMPDAALRRAAVVRQETGIVVHHYGHVVDLERRETKTALYASLLRKKLKETPEDPQARYEMAVQLVSEDRQDLAVQLLRRTVEEMPEHEVAYRSRLLLGRLLIEAGQVASGTGQLESAVRDRPELPAGWLEAARGHARVGNRDSAARFVEQGRWLFPADPMLQEMQARLSAAATVRTGD